MGGAPMRARPIGAIFEEGHALTKFPKIFYICTMTFKEILRNCKQKIIDGKISRSGKNGNTQEKKTTGTRKEQNQ
tara:strand:- start:178 stop:402 length:225 start_codon:yes stop_codon:yes gene_type:complete